MRRIRIAQPSPATVVALIALFVALGGTSYAVTGLGSSSARRFYACVTQTFHTLNLTNASAACPAGERKISWDPTGQRGARGPRGAKGPGGIPGSTGAIGPQGPQGNAGASGAQGAPGPRGAAGSQGPKGDTGATGSSGATGPQGTIASVVTRDRLVSVSAGGSAQAVQACNAGEIVVGGQARPITDGDPNVHIIASRAAGDAAGNSPTDGTALYGWFGSASNSGATTDTMVVSAFCGTP
jgi:Collagen triple helix repeat (20 copies)